MISGVIEAERIGLLVEVSELALQDVKSSHNTSDGPYADI
jgi:hypothetical protein